MRPRRAGPQDVNGPEDVSSREGVSIERRIVATVTSTTSSGDGMSDEPTPESLRRELADIDAELADLRRVAGDVQARRGTDGDESVGYVEPEDIATELTGLEETQAVIGALETRREAVSERLRALDS